MRICHVTEASDPSYGGLYTATHGLADAMSRIANVESQVARSAALGECADADLCHAHGMWARSAVTSLAWRLRHARPLIVAPHGMLDEWALRRRAAVKRAALATYEGLRLRRAHCLHALCEAEAVSIRRVVPDKPVVVVPNGVDLPRLEDVQAMRRSHIARDGRQTLLFLGRIDPKKGIDNALRGFAAVVTRNARLRAEWKLAVCGYGDAAYIAKLADLASELGISDLVSFERPVQGDDKHRRLATASAFVLTSMSEGLPMAVLEAWAYALPSLISHACNLSVPASGGAALVCTPAPGNVDGGLLDLLRLEAPEADAMGAAARAYVEREHAWDRIAARMMQVYRWALGGGTLPAQA